MHACTTIENQEYSVFVDILFYLIECGLTSSFCRMFYLPSKFTVNLITAIDYSM